MDHWPHSSGRVGLVGVGWGRQIPAHSFTGSLALAQRQRASRALLRLQFLGRYETVLFYWPSLLCLAFLLGRFLHMFVKSLRVHLGWELPMVSTECEHRVPPRGSALRHRPGREALFLLLPFCMRDLGPGVVGCITRGHVAGLEQSGICNQTARLLRLSLNHCAPSGRTALPNSWPLWQRPVTRVCEPKHTPISFLTGRKAFPGSSPGAACQTAPEEAPPAVSPGCLTHPPCVRPWGRALRCGSP